MSIKLNILPDAAGLDAAGLGATGLGATGTESAGLGFTCALVWAATLPDLTGELTPFTTLFPLESAKIIPIMNVSNLKQVWTYYKPID